MKPSRNGEYQSRGDYHIDLDPDWSYAPLYRRKIVLVDRFITGLPQSTKILDVGAGEGLLVERYRKLSYPIHGVDSHYSSPLVERASILSLPFPDGTYDAILCLDVLEHLPLVEQPAALEELKRILSQDGRLLLSLPNLAHLHSRLRFFLRGRLTRTSAVERHPGDRPIEEYIELLGACGFRIVSRRGIFPTVPFLFRLVNRRAASMGWLVAFLDRLLPLPGLCFLNILEARKKEA
jgi:SAM-dependent methyltransferase